MKHGFRHLRFARQHRSRFCPLVSDTAFPLRHQTRQDCPLCANPNSVTQTMVRSCAEADRYAIGCRTWSISSLTQPRSGWPARCGKENKPETVLLKISRKVLAEMMSATRRTAGCKKWEESDLPAVLKSSQSLWRKRWNSNLAEATMDRSHAFT